MKRLARIASLAILCCLFFLAACSSTSVYIPVQRPAALNLLDLPNLFVASIRPLDASDTLLYSAAIAEEIEDILSKTLTEDGRFTVLDRDRMKAKLAEAGLAADAAPNRSTASDIYTRTGIRGWIHGTLLMARYDETVTTARVRQSNRVPADKNVRMGLVRLRLLLTVYDLERTTVLWNDTLDASASAECKAVDRSPAPLDADQLLTDALASMRQNFERLITPRQERALVTFLRDAEFPDVLKGIRAVSEGRMRAADSIFHVLVRRAHGSDNEDVHWYNLGIVQQYRNNFRDAQESFEYALRIRDNARYRQALHGLLDMEQEYLELLNQKKVR